MMNELKLSRRQLLKASGVAGGSLIIGVSLPGCATRIPAGTEQHSLRPNAWVEVTQENRFILTLDRVEMGQGTYTGMSTLMAEDLDVPPEKIEVIFAPVAEPYKQPVFGLQITGGSTSISSNWQRLREASAAARIMLEAAAASVWQVPADQVRGVDGVCINQKNGARISYGQVASLAAELQVPTAPQLRAAADYKYIGKLNKRLDAAPKVFGQAEYGIDVELPGMLHAVLSRPPMIGGQLKSVDAAKAKAMPGVRAVLTTPYGVAVVAERYWQARKAQNALQLEWQPGKIGTPSSDDVFAFYKELAAEESGSSVRDVGDFGAAHKTAANTLEVEYQAPFLAHATMEPQNCTAHVTADKCEIWAPTQGPDIARAVAVRETGLSHDQIHVHTTFIGGGFGRRLSQDFVAECVAIAKLVDAPVKLLWSREEDTQHDIFRPASYHRLTASFDEKGGLTGWHHQILCPRILDYYVKDAAGAIAPTWAPQFMVRTMGKIAPTFTPDTSPTEGAADIPYAIANIDVRHVQADSGIPVTYWRSVGHSQNAFVVESFIDEVARRQGKDPFQYRDGLLAQQPRLQATLRAAAAKADWGKPKADGVFQGIACHQSFNTFVTEVVDLKVENGQIKVQRVVCAVDCGQIVNPDMVVAQMQSGIIFGLTAALYGEITLKDGRVQQSNFDDYQMLRIYETPEIDVVLLPNSEAPTGVGEPGVPPLAPAIANAVFAATGKRLRQLPLRLG